MLSYMLPYITKMDKLEMRKKIYENLPWILTVLSAIIILISKIEVTPNVVINDILEKPGIAMFSSGVFVAVLKSRCASHIYLLE